MKFDDCRGFHDAINEACTCGGESPGACCPACEVYHAIKDWEVAAEPHRPVTTSLPAQFSELTKARAAR